MKCACESAAAKKVDGVWALVRKFGKRFNEILVELPIGRIAGPAVHRDIVKFKVAANCEAGEDGRASEDLCNVCFQRRFGFGARIIREGDSALSGFHDVHFATRLSQRCFAGPVRDIN